MLGLILLLVFGLDLQFRVRLRDMDMARVMV